MKIYTKTGDLGKTSLGSGKRVVKHHPRIECYGTVDELNSILGLAAAYIESKLENNRVQQIQNELFNLGSILACDSPKKLALLPQITEKNVTNLENWIDEYTESLPPLRNFILPGGSREAATIHLARCVCRRAERLLSLASKKNKFPKWGLIYLNRLSDFLFVFARHLNQRKLIADVEWNKSN